MTTQGIKLAPRPMMPCTARDFLPAALEILETPPSPMALSLSGVICLALFALISWSCLTYIDIYAIAEGKIQPSGRSKIVQPVETSEVVAVHVKNGQRVNEGDVLVELDHTESAANLDATRLSLMTSTAEALRRQKELSLLRAGEIETPGIIDFPADIDTQIADRENGLLAVELGQLRANLQNLDAQLSEKIAASKRLQLSTDARAKQIALAQELVTMREQISNKGMGSRSQIIEVLQQLEALKTFQARETGELAETDASIALVHRRIDAAKAEFASDQTSKLAEAERKRDQLRNEYAKAKMKTERTKLSASISGTVQQLAITTVGQVVSSGQVLMTIVPQEAAIEIEALILNKDIGFVETDQKATVKVDAFPFTRYGTVDGTVKTVSRDAVALKDAADAAATVGQSPAQQGRAQSYVFPATITLATDKIASGDKLLPLSPGMSVTVEIKTGQRRVIDFLLSPLRENAAGVGHER